MSVTTTCRDLSKLNPHVRAKVEQWLRQCNAAGLDVRISETYRSPERQEYLYKQGLSGVKTLGAHYFGVAVDFFFVENGTTAYPAAKMKAAADIAKKLGFEWGGDWVMKDTPHLQMLGGVTLAQYRQGKRPKWYYENPETSSPGESTAKDDDEMQKVFNAIEEIKADAQISWAAPIIADMRDKGIVKGKAGGALDLTERDIRTLEFCRRMIAENYVYVAK